MSEEHMKPLQDLVNELKECAEFSKYVEEHKLRLIDSRMKYLDDLLNAGILDD